MTTLNSLATKAKRFSWFIILLFLALIFGFLITIRFFFRQPPALTNKAPNPPNFETLPASGSNEGFDISGLTQPSYPKDLPTYAVKPDGDLLTQAQAFAQKLNFSKPPLESSDINLGNGLLFTNETGVLSVFSNNLSYLNGKRQKSPASFDVEVQKTKAKEFILSLGLEVDITSDPEIKYVKYLGESTTETGDSQEANLIRFIFGNTINNYKIIGDTHGAKVTLNSQSQITGLTFSKLALTADETYPLISFNDALNLLQKNRGSLIKIVGDRDDVETIEKISKVKLKNAYVGYYLEPKNPQTVQPVWAFEGSSLTTEGLPVEVTYVVSAIAQPQ